MVNPYNLRYYNKHIIDGRYPRLAIGIFELCKMFEFLPTAVLDVGCATGGLLEQLRIGFPNTLMVGIDHGSIPTEYWRLINDEYARFVDIDLNIIRVGCKECGELTHKQYPLVTCMEVAEHIVQGNESNLLDFLVNSLDETGVLVFTSGDNRGRGHVNMHFRGYWIEEFIKRGLIYKANVTRRLSNIWEKNNVHTFYTANVSVFRRAGNVANIRDLCECAQLPA